MHRILITATAITLGLVVEARADSKVFDVGDFTKVVAKAGVNVTIVQGDTWAVSAEGTARALKRLDISATGGKLTISQSAKGLDRWSPILSWTSHSALVTVALPALESLVVTAGADVAASGAYADPFSASLSSGADAVLTGIAADSVGLEVSSGADLTASGTCGALIAASSSGADLDASDLACDSAGVTASSGADLSVRAAKVTADASSGADIDVYGGGEVTADESSGGDVDLHD